MPTNDLIERNDSTALMPEDAADLIDGVTETSAVLRLARGLPPMTRSQRRIPVWESLPHAYFVDGDVGLKQTTKVSWKNVYINAEEIAVIVPLPEAVLDDSAYPIFDLAKPRIVEAAGILFDQAVLYGTNAPASWPDDIVTAATAAGKVVALGDVGDIYDDIMGEGGIMNLVEESGYLPSGNLAALRMKAKLRGLREKDYEGQSTGEPIFVTDMKASTPYALDGEPLFFPRNGAIDPAQTLMVTGDWTQLVYSIRQDITFKILDQAVITDSEGAIVYNLAQQDMVALRFVFRLGWALPNPINRVDEDDETRFPFAVLTPAGS